MVSLSPDNDYDILLIELKMVKNKLLQKDRKIVELNESVVEKERQIIDLQVYLLILIVTFDHQI